MVMETAGWFALIGGVVLYAALWAIPATRPYAKKYWWMAVALGAMGVGMILLRKRTEAKFENSKDDQETGHAIAEETTDTVGAIVDYAQAEQARADADLAMKQLKTEQERAKFQAQLDAVDNVSDSRERRKALIVLVEKA